MNENPYQSPVTPDAQLAEAARMQAGVTLRIFRLGCATAGSGLTVALWSIWSMINLSVPDVLWPPLVILFYVGLVVGTIAVPVAFGGGVAWLLTRPFARR